MDACVGEVACVGLLGLVRGLAGLCVGLCVGLCGLLAVGLCVGLCGWPVWLLM